MEKSSKREKIVALVFVLLALVSFFILARLFSGQTAFSGAIGSLTEKQHKVAEISGISIAAASILELIPGGDALSKELVELGGYFILLLAAIYLEKILINIGGAVAFKILFPIGLLLAAGYFISKAESLKNISKKLISFGIVLFLLVPSSVWISDAVERNQDFLSSQQEIEELQTEISGIEGDSEENSDSNDSNEDASWLDKAKDKLSGTVTSMKALPARIKGFPAYVKGKYDAFMDFIAFFIVTTCVIPIVVLILLIEIVKHLFGITAKINYVAAAKLPGGVLAKARVKKDEELE